MTKKKESPHDRLVKFTFGQAERAAALFKSKLPEAVVRSIDWSTLRPERNRLVDESLAELCTDLLFSARLKDTDEEESVLLYLHMEHQSTIDHMMAFRIIRYMVRIWDEYVSEQPSKRKKLPAIFPVVLYHGDKPWNAPTEVRELINYPMGPSDAHLPKLQFILDDISKATDAEIEARTLDVFSQITLKALTRIRGTPDVQAELQNWLPLLRRLVVADSAKEKLTALFVYLKSVAEFEAQTINIVEQLGKPAEEALMTAAERLRAEGRDEGRREGRDEGRREGRREGRGEGETKILLNLLRLKYGELSPETEQKVANASTEDREHWSARILFAEKLSDIFDS